MLATVLSAVMTDSFVLTGNIKVGLPEVQLPPFSYSNDQNYTLPFMSMIEELKSGIILVPILSVIGNVAIAKTFCNLLFVCLFFVLII